VKYRNLLLGGSTTFGALVSLGTAFQLPRFEELRIENTAVLTFEVMLYLSVLLCGLAGILATRNTKNIRLLLEKSTDYSLSIFGSAAMGLIGYSFGLTVFSLLTSNYNNVLIGCVLTFYLSMMAYQPFVWAREMQKLSKAKLDRIFTEFKYPQVFLGMSSTLIVLGLYGLNTIFYTT
jgi:hypothetical protein